MEIKTLINRVLKETKDTGVDYNKDFEIAIKEGNIIITQLFGYYTKYPIFIETNGEIKNQLSKIEKCDIDVVAVYTDQVNNRIAIVIEFNVDSKQLDNILNLKVKLVSGKESIYKI